MIKDASEPSIMADVAARVLQKIEELDAEALPPVSWSRDDFVSLMTLLYGLSISNRSLLEAARSIKDGDEARFRKCFEGAEALAKDAESRVHRLVISMGAAVLEGR